MTIKSFLTDAYTWRFNAKVIGIETINNRTAIVLDHTFFYPEGGGQPCDLGTINGIKIEDVQISNDVISHITSELVSIGIGEIVEAQIDENRRLTLMQQHSGQHLLSSCAEKLYNANTVGFHIGDDYITIDLDQKLDQVQIRALEKSANALIYKNLEIVAHYPSSEELTQMPLRKQPKVTENIRVIEIVGADFSPCGGTHLKRTGEIGVIKIKRVEPYKTGVRIEFGCGYFALNFMNERNELINQLMRLFSVKDNEILSFSDLLIQKQKEDKAKLQLYKEKLIGYEVELLMQGLESEDDTETIKIITLNEVDLPMVDLRYKVGLITSVPNRIVIGASHEDGKSHLVVAKSDNITDNIDIGRLFKEIAGTYGIRGGGSKTVAQGGTTERVDLEALIEAFEAQISRQL
ncbi:MAG: hypothetical protein BGO41_13015 [Clostridiales bacterium 38-18]|nr:MAG: hypothetical protein BGO41_13015 [Clostridiales bacterium 38-18]